MTWKPRETGSYWNELELKEYSTQKLNLVIIYSPSYHSKPEWVSFLYGTERKDILKNVQTFLNPIEVHRLPQNIMEVNRIWNHSVTNIVLISDPTDFYNIFHPYYVGNQMVLGPINFYSMDEK